MCPSYVLTGAQKRWEVAVSPIDEAGCSAVRGLHTWQKSGIFNQAVQRPRDFFHRYSTLKSKSRIQTYLHWR